jgi:hypothetical protein
MNIVEMIARTRLSAFLETTSVDFTDNVIINELNDQLSQLYERAVVRSHQGYWLKQLIIPIVAGTDRYRMPDRAVTGGLERLQIADDSTLQWRDLEEVPEAQAHLYELGTGQTGLVNRYCMRGDQINLLPDPDGSQPSLRLNYYLRPNRLTPTQGTAALVTSVILATRTIVCTTASLLNYQPDGTSALMVGAGNLIDVIGPGGWHETQLVGEPATVGSNTFACTGTGDLTTIRAGDYVRAAGQTEWACVPDDFHRTIADAAAVKILVTRTMNDKAAPLKELLDDDLSRFGDLLLPRVQTAGIPIVAPISMYRGRNRSPYPVKYP